MAKPPRGRGGQRRRDYANRDAVFAQAMDAMRTSAPPRLPPAMPMRPGQPIRPQFPGATIDANADRIGNPDFLHVPDYRTDIMDRTPQQRQAITVTPHESADANISPWNVLNPASIPSAMAQDALDSQDLVDVQMDDGTIVEGVPANINPDDLLRMYNEQRTASEAGRQGAGYAPAFIDSAGDMLAFGGADEIASYPDAAVRKLAGDPRGYEAVRADALRKFRAEMNANREQYPGTSLAGSVTGALAPLLFTGGASGVAPAAGGGGQGFMAGAKAFGREVAPVAAQSALYGFNSAEGGASDRLAAVPDALKAGLGGYAAARLAGMGASRMFGGRTVDPHVRLLADEGVTMTPGQRAGQRSMRNVYEDKVLGSIPFVSDVPAAARARGANDLRVAAANRVLAPIGGRVPRGTPINSDAIGALQEQVYGAYDDALNSLSLRPERQLAQSLRQIQADAPRMVGDAGMGQINATVAHIDDMLQNGAMSGGVLRDTMSQIRGVASSNAGTEIGNQLWRIHDELDGALARQNSGQAATAYRNARRSVSLLKRVEDAASRPGATNGEFSPTNLYQATRRLGYGTTRGNIANGTAPMLDLANAGADVLRNTTANSGTIPRAVGVTGMVGATGGATAVNPLLGGIVGASMIGYAPGIDRLLQSAALNRPQWARTAAEALDRQRRPIGLLGTGSALGLLNQ